MVLSRKSATFLAIAFLIAEMPAAAGDMLKIMPLGDSNTRGTYPVGEAGPHPASIGAGGYRYPLQNMLTAGGYTFDFVGSQTTNAVGTRGGSSPDAWTYDPAFDRDHQGLAGFTNSMLISGGSVPSFTGDPVNDAPSLADSLAMYKPDIILLMSGTNVMSTTNVVANLETLNQVINVIVDNSPQTHLIVSTIYDRWDSTSLHTATDAYNAGIPALVETARERGGLVTFVDTGASLTEEDFRYDGVLGDGKHPNPLTLFKPAEVWYEGIQAVASPAPEPNTMLMLIALSVFFGSRRLMRRNRNIGGHE